MRISILLSLFSLTGCAAWNAGIHDPVVVAHAIQAAQPYKQIADAVYPHAGIVMGAILIPMFILIDGFKVKK